MNRKEFIRTMMRWGVGGMLLACAGFLLTNRGVSLSGNCSGSAVCGQCSKAGNCPRPEYKTYLENEQKQNS